MFGENAQRPTEGASGVSVERGLKLLAELGVRLLTGRSRGRRASPLACLPAKRASERTRSFSLPVARALVRSLHLARQRLQPPLLLLLVC